MFVSLFEQCSDTHKVNDSLSLDAIIEVWNNDRKNTSNSPKSRFRIIQKTSFIQLFIMTTSLTSTQSVQQELNDFVDYIDSFYGVNDPLYPLVKETDG